MKYTKNDIIGMVFKLANTSYYNTKYTIEMIKNNNEVIVSWQNKTSNTIYYLENVLDNLNKEYWIPIKINKKLYEIY